MAAPATSRCLDVRAVTEVPGLTHVRAFLSGAQQAGLAQLLDLEGLFENGNQAMLFGSAAIPGWCQDLLQSLPVHLLPEEVRQRQPVFNCVVANRYACGEGIKAHVDLLRFRDGVCIAALGSSAVLEFTHPAKPAVVEVHMAAGDLVLMHGAARYEWLHAISNRRMDVWSDGTLRPRSTRVSLTFRWLAPDA